MSLKSFYSEDKDGDQLKASTAEVVLFAMGSVFLLVYALLNLFGKALSPRYAVLLIPTLLWVFMRSSRKDMTATANFIAGLFGALGGAILIIVARLLK